MTKQSIIAYAVLILLGIVLVQHFLYQNEIYKAQILVAETRAADFEKADGELKGEIRRLESEQAGLVQKVADKEIAIDGLEQDIVNIKVAHEIEIASTFRLDTDDETIVKFKKVFPEFAAGASTILQEVKYDNPDGTVTLVPILYAKLPTAFLEHFIRLDADVDSLTGQVEKHEGINELNKQIKTLKDENFALEVSKREEYQNGYNFAAKQFKATNDEYIALLKERRLGGTLRMVGSLVAGIALGVNF